MIKLLKAGLFNSTDKFKKAKETIHRYSNKYEIELYVEGEGESYVAVSVNGFFGLFKFIRTVKKTCF